MKESRVLPSSLFPIDDKCKTFCHPLPTSASRSPSLLAHKPFQSARQYPEIIPIKHIHSREEDYADQTHHKTPAAVPSPVLATFQDTDQPVLAASISSTSNDHFQDASTLIYDEDDLNDSVIIFEDLSVAAHVFQPATTSEILPSVPDTPPKSPPALDSPLMFEAPALNKNNLITKAILNRNDGLPKQNSGGDVNIVNGNDVMVVERGTQEMIQTVEPRAASSMKITIGNGSETECGPLDGNNVESSMGGACVMDCSVSGDSISVPQRKTKRLNVRKSTRRSTRACSKSSMVNYYFVL